MAVLGMKKNNLRLCCLAVLFCCWSFLLAQPTNAAAPTVRIKDIAHVLEARDNQLIGFGLVVGLRNTGDKSQTGFTQQALTNLMSRLGVVPQSVSFKSRNVAAVMVTTTLPPFVKPGQKIDVTVSSMGDATSLQDGTLLITPLHGVDENVYAVAQGSLLVGIDSTTTNLPYINYQQATVGRIPNGALVEKEVPVAIGKTGKVTIVLDQPDFTTANRVEAALKSAGLIAAATDAGTVTVEIPESGSLVSLLAKVETLTVVPDAIAKIIVSERTGTIVIGDNVRIEPVAVSYAGIDVLIGDINLFSEGNNQNYNYDYVRYRATSLARLKKSQANLKTISAGTTLSALVKSLNIIGASPKDLIAILQAMKKSGAIKAELEVI